MRALKYYYGGAIDKQGRIVLGDFLSEHSKVIIYIEDEREDFVFIEPFVEDLDFPCSFARTIDSKKRVVLPKWFRKDYNRVLIGYQDGRAVVRLIKE